MPGKQLAFVGLVITAFVAFLAWNRFVRTNRPVFADPSARPVRIAASAVDAFHEGLNHRHYAAVCKMAAAAAFRGVTDLNCTDFLAYVRGRLGDALDDRRSQLPLVEDVPAGQPLRVALEYETRFARATATEHFEWRIADGNATLISYRVSAARLWH